MNLTFLVLAPLALASSGLAQGKVVRLEHDVERKDRFGRTLAYVYLPDGTFLNAEIVKQGYGHAYTQFPFRYLGQFQGYEREARAAGRGLWAEAPAVTRPTGDADVRGGWTTFTSLFQRPRCWSTTPFAGVCSSIEASLCGNGHYGGGQSTSR